MKNESGIEMYQPATTDSSADGLMRARNAMRERLEADPCFAHRWLCHPERDCEDGCDERAHHDRLALYLSPMESEPGVWIWNFPGKSKW